jgi:hypothetical protein
MISMLLMLPLLTIAKTPPEWGAVIASYKLLISSNYR